MAGKDSLPLEQRLFNAVCILTLPALIVIVPANWLMGFKVVSINWLVILFVLLYIIYLSRKQQGMRFAFVLFIIAAFFGTTVNFFFNAGTAGPTISIMLLVVTLLGVMSPLRNNRWWLVPLVAMVLTWLYLECEFPLIIQHHYASDFARNMDWGITFLFSVLFVYNAIRILRKGYDSERKAALKLSNEVQESRKAESEASLQKDRLLSLLAHDLRSPLASIQSYFELLKEQRELLSEEEMVSIESKLSAAVQSTMSTMDNILLWSRRQMSGQSMALQEVDAVQIAEEVMNLQKPLAESKSILLTLTSEHQVMAYADAIALETVLRNLVHNALKFTPDGGSVHIRIESKNEGCEIHVVDTGVGIDEATYDRLFSFEFCNSYGTRNEKGTGLGLPLCKELVHDMGGEIRIQSGPGLGSTFSVVLPSKTERPVTPAA